MCYSEQKYTVFNINKLGTNKFEHFNAIFRLYFIPYLIYYMCFTSYDIEFLTSL